jgi:hypothetical protein
VILALDLAKSKSIFCRFETTTGEVTFGEVATRRPKLAELLEGTKPDRVVIEVCPLAGWIHARGSSSAVPECQRLVHSARRVPEGVICGTDMATSAGS